jgi:predicted RNA-binding Zn-ribbon protein involved in translation (DUF1610 family)
MADYQKQWQAYKKLRNQVLAAPVLVLMVILVGLILKRWILDSLTLQIVCIFIGGGLFATVFAIAIRVEKWRCPRCGKRFVSFWASSAMVFNADKCANCGLAKFAND